MEILPQREKMAREVMVVRRGKNGRRKYRRKPTN